MTKRNYQAIAKMLHNIRLGTEDEAGVWALDRVAQDLGWHHGRRQPSLRPRPVRPGVRDRDLQGDAAKGGGVMRHYQPSGTLTFEHTTREGIEAVATCRFDAGDLSAGWYPSWYLEEATIAGAVILDSRDAFARYLGSRELDKIEEHAGDLYEDMANEARAEQQAARADDPDDREDW